MKLAAPNVVIFDLDGTLIDWCASAYAELEATFKLHNITMPEDFEQQANEILAEGLQGARSSFEALLEDYDAGRFVNLLKTFHQQNSRHPVLFPDAEKVLHYLKENEVYIGIATTNNKTFAEKMTKQLGIRHVFNGIAGSEDKNHEAFYKEDLLQKLKSEAKKPWKDPVWFVGDDLGDMYTAFMTGAVPFAFQNRTAKTMLEDLAGENYAEYDTYDLKQNTSAEVENISVQPEQFIDTYDQFLSTLRQLFPEKQVVPSDPTKADKLKKPRSTRRPPIQPASHGNGGKPNSIV